MSAVVSNQRSLLVALIVALAIAANSTGSAGGSLLLPKTSLWTKASTMKSPAESKAICAEMIKRERASKIGMTDASTLYTFGDVNGVPCVKVDYFKAWQLAHESGSAFSEKATLTFMRGRAEGGNDKAIAALAKIEKELKAAAKH